VIDGENAKFIAVKTGINGEFDIEIKSGLKEGLEVITGPNKALSELSDGSKVKKEKTKTAAKK
jgi:HlyD family secretion protein